jgi:myo-inositol-1(or 4)-monophosphatase
MTDDLTHFMALAQQAVGLGYDLVKNTTPAEVRLKGDRDVVTEVDLQIEQEVRAFLCRATPDFGFLGEEEGGTTDPTAAEYLWTLDPVDGTSNFAHGLPLCAISLALLHHGDPIVAAIVAPQLGLRYYAAKGRGAFGNDGQLQVSKATDLSKAIVSIGDYAVGPGAAEKNAVRLRLTALLAERVERIRMFGTAALDLAWVAEGRTDATILLSNKPWDTGAGVLIARESGAQVVDAAGSQHHADSAHTIASSPDILSGILDLINEPV